MVGAYRLVYGLRLVEQQHREFSSALVDLRAVDHERDQPLDDRPRVGCRVRVAQLVEAAEAGDLDGRVRERWGHVGGRRAPFDRGCGACLR